jgi:hypothetical protein
MAATDDYAAAFVPPYAPCRHAAAVAPNDVTELTNVSRFLFVGGAGNLKVVTVGGETVTLTGVAAGTLLPLAVKQVIATLTTATNIVSLW